MSPEFAGLDIEPYKIGTMRYEPDFEWKIQITRQTHCRNTDIRLGYYSSTTKFVFSADPPNGFKITEYTTKSLKHRAYVVNKLNIPIEIHLRARPIIAVYGLRHHVVRRPCIHL